MQELSQDAVVRGIDGMLQWATENVKYGRPVTRSALYRLVESNAIEVTRLNGKGSMVVTTVRKLRKAFGLDCESLCDREAA